MLNFLRMAAVAVIVAVTFTGSVGTGVAATVSLSNGASINPIKVGDIYTYEETLLGKSGKGSRSFVFTAAVLDTPLKVVAGNVTLTFFGKLTKPVLTWFDGVTTTKAKFDNILGANGKKVGVSTTLSTLFVAPDALTQTLTFGWKKYKGPVQVSMQVAAVPLPAAGFLLLGALGGLAALRRRNNPAV